MNEHGDCPDTEVFLLLPGDEFHPDEEDEIEFEPLLSKFSQYILKEIRKSMHQVSVHKWLSFSGFAPPKTDSSGDGLQERFLKWTKQLKPGESANKKDFEVTLSTRDKTNLQVLISSKNSKINRGLSAQRIQTTRTRGRYGGTIFTKLES